MELVFDPEGHTYSSVNKEDKMRWISVTTLVDQFKEHFDGPAKAEKCSVTKKSPWYKMAPDKILEVWEKERKRSTDLGTYYHQMKEDSYKEAGRVDREGKLLSVFMPEEKDGKKYSPNQRLVEGVYPEHFMYLRSAGVSGQSDMVEVVNGKVNIRDYKTNKEITTEGYRSWDGYVQRLLPPLNHLEKCHLVSYGLQLSIYMYIVLRHNPQLECGDIVIEHVIFEEEKKDEFGYPVTKYDETGKPVLKEVIPYQVKYYKNEVLKMFQWLETNRDKIPEKKAVIKTEQSTDEKKAE